MCKCILVSFFYGHLAWVIMVGNVSCGHYAKLLNFLVKKEQLWLKSFLEQHLGIMMDNQSVLKYRNIFFIYNIYSLPTTKVLPFEHPDLITYDEAYRKGKENIYCAMAYPNCGFSLHGIALGKYSDPPKNFM